MTTRTPRTPTVVSSSRAKPRRGRIARAASDAAQATAGVARLHAGALGEYATYADGERIDGIRLVMGDVLQVRLRVVARYGYHLPAVAFAVSEAVKENVSPLAGRSQVDVHIVDLDIDDVDAAGETDQGSGLDKG
jgi:uncharacterized alkaline shock family protein YloU